MRSYQPSTCSFCDWKQKSYFWEGPKVLSKLYVHTQHDLKHLSSRIRRIEGLENLTKLDVLDLHGNQIKEVTRLDHLSELRVLNLAGNLIELVDNLSGMDALTELNLRRNRIRSVVSPVHPDGDVLRQRVNLKWSLYRRQALDLFMHSY